MSVPNRSMASAWERRGNGGAVTFQSVNSRKRPEKSSSTTAKTSSCSTKAISRSSAVVAASFSGEVEFAGGAVGAGIFVAVVVAQVQEQYASVVPFAMKPTAQAAWARSGSSEDRIRSRTRHRAQRDYCRRCYAKRRVPCACAGMSLQKLLKTKNPPLRSRRVVNSQIGPEHARYRSNPNSVKLGRATAPTARTSG